MKTALFLSLLILLGSAGPVPAEQESVAAPEAGRKLGELASLPEGLAVAHSPDPVHATLFPPSLSGVQWAHDTTVSSRVGPVTLVEYGYFVERNGRWEWPYGEEVPYTYTAGDFADRYGCPGAELKPGESYTDAQNRSVIDCVPEQRVKWYFIGQDAHGRPVKGEAVVTMLAEQVPDVEGPGQ